MEVLFRKPALLWVNGLPVLLAFFLFSCLFCSCDSWKPAYKPVSEVSAYSEKVLEAALPLSLNLECEKGTLEIYNWEKSEVKFEITRKITGTQNKSLLERQLEDFQIEMKKDRETLSFFGRQKRIFGSRGEGRLEVKVFIPRRTVRIYCRMREGTLRCLDDLNCRLEVDAGTIHAQINNLEGLLLFKAEKGDLRVSSGNLENGSMAAVKQGNLRIRSQWEEPGEYSVETGTGMLELQLPAEQHAEFLTSGVAELDEFKQGDFAARFKLTSGAGEIRVKKIQ